jgi:hypothetical protein
MSWMDPELVWGVFTRLIGVVYFIAFASLWGEITTLVGQRGILPVGVRLAAIRRDFSVPGRYLRFPTLLWFGHSDAALRGLLATGMLAALVVIFGGSASFVALLVAYVAFLSLNVPFAMSLPWECALYEAGIFALFLPATLPLPELVASAAPAPALAWAYRLLLFRIVFGFGKFKFIGSSRRDLSYLQGFLINQPLPTVVAWYGHRLPLIILKIGVVFLFLVEIPGALLSLIPGWIGLVGGAGILGLMIVIHACGNFGYFNWIVAALCVPLLDSETPRALELAHLFDRHAPWVANAFVLAHTLGVLAYFPWSSYMSQNWHRYTLFLKVKPRWLLAPLRVLSALAPFRWLHAYGVFPPKSMAPVRNVAVVEVSYDGETWHELEYPHAATQPAHRPRFMAPHMARWEQHLIYETYGTTAHALAYSVANMGVPYGYTPLSDAECLLQRLLEGERYEGVIFKAGSFPRNEPPRLARMRVFMLRPTTPAELRRTGLWWTRELVGPHYPERARDDSFWERWLPEPELFDLDDVLWRRQSVLGRLMRRASTFREGDDLAALVVDPASGGQGISKDDVDRFFTEFLPVAHAEEERAWSNARARAEQVRALYSPMQLRRFERIAGRLGSMLEARLEPHFLGDAAPHVDFPTYYHFALFTQHVIAKGRAAVEDVLLRPASATEHVADFSLESGMYLSAMFRLERLAWESSKIRLLDCVLARSTERFPESERADYERRLEGLAKKMWGVAELTPLLRNSFRESPLGAGATETYPDFIELPSGEIVMSAEQQGPEAGSAGIGTRVSG